MRLRKVLYFTDSKAPYRTVFFNKLAEYCELTVLYEYSSNNSRDKKWSEREEIDHSSLFLDKISNNENTLKKYLCALKILLDDYDDIIFGCYNEPSQMFCIFMLKLLRKKYILNFDGEIFFVKGEFKTLIKKFFIKGADKYIIAGETAKQNLQKEMDLKNVFSYSFSSLTDKELANNRIEASNYQRNNTVLVVGRYLDANRNDYKGLSTAIEAAKLNPNIKWKFVGTGPNTERFIKDFNINDIKNIEVISFLQKEELNKEYCKCGVFVLPSKRECWGLVINEAASFGTPIVTSDGSGAGVDFLLNSPFKNYIFKNGDSNDLLEKVTQCLNSDNTEYSNYLINKSKDYTIEENVKQHIFMLEH